MRTESKNKPADRSVGKRVLLLANQNKGKCYKEPIRTQGKNEQIN